MTIDFPVTADMNDIQAGLYDLKCAQSCVEGNNICLNAWQWHRGTKVCIVTGDKAILVIARLLSLFCIFATSGHSASSTYPLQPPMLTHLLTRINLCGRPLWQRTSPKWPYAISDLCKCWRFAAMLTPLRGISCKRCTAKGQQLQAHLYQRWI